MQIEIFFQRTQCLFRLCFWLEKIEQHMVKCIFIGTRPSVTALDGGHGVRQPRAQAGEGPKPSIEPPRPYSPLDINKLMRREAENG
jgi:hypothetical protein